MAERRKLRQLLEDFLERWRRDRQAWHSVSDAEQEALFNAAVSRADSATRIAVEAMRYLSDDQLYELRGRLDALDRDDQQKLRRAS